MYKRQLSLVLMVLTIGAIIFFQAFWLRKTFVEEKRVVKIRTDQLFRETVFKLQASKLHIDTGWNIHFEARSGAINLTNVIRERIISDSAGKGSAGQMIFTVDSKGPERIQDTVVKRMTRIEPKVLHLLSGVDSLQEPITVEEVQAQYAKQLAKEAIRIPFTVTAVPMDSKQRYFPFDDSAGSKVVVGFSKPVRYDLNLGGLFWYTARRVGPQAIFSLLLVGCTIFSFLLLYRNWQRQRRLTQLKNDFISNITHELKTPIATVSVAVEALRNFNALQDPVRTQEYLDISANELQRLSLLVDKVLKLSLFEREEIELQHSRFDLKALVEEVMASMRLQFEKYGASVALRTGPSSSSPPDQAGMGAAPEPDFHLRADKLHITSVIFNLLDNALKYSGLHPSIQIGLEAGREQLTLSVSDNGIGISPAYQEKIFEKFFRVPTGDRHNVKGYGLGLSYVSYVLERQGGIISVDSKEGAGSRFTVKIPRDHV